MEKIRGLVTRIIKANPETGNIFAAIKYEGVGGTVDAKFSIYNANLAVGDFFLSEGTWQTRKNERYNSTEEIFRGKSAFLDVPATKAGFKLWFSQILTPEEHGVTADSLAQFMATYGDHMERIIDERPDYLPALSTKPQQFKDQILKDIGRRVSGRRARKLMEHAGVDRKAISSILRVFGEGVYDVLKTDPYQASSFKDVGFSNADRIGGKIGIDREDDRRIGAAIHETLEGIRQEGHTFADANELGKRLNKTYGITLNIVADYILRNHDNTSISFLIETFKNNFIVSLKELSFGEHDIAKSAVKLLKNGPVQDRTRLDRVLEDLFGTEDAKKFDDIQKAGVRTALASPFAILTGGPGTGKSTVSKIITSAVEKLGSGPIHLCAPTGKAAKRLEETTKRRAVTIHTLLGAQFDAASGQTTFKRNAGNPLPPRSFVLVDEASMVDVPTMRALFEALPGDGRLLLVGDKDQLPSVDAGSVLSDLMAAQIGGGAIVPVAELINVYRQKQDNRIAHDARDIKNGVCPVLTKEFDRGVLFIDCPADQISFHLQRLVVDKIYKQQRYDPDKFAILTPQAPGLAGTVDINSKLTRALNPSGAAIEGVFKGPDDDADIDLPRVGDRVMLKENRHELNVANGDVGTIVRAFSQDNGSYPQHFFSVLFDSQKDKPIDFRASEWRQFMLAYAITIHKSQGSQYPIVIMPITMAHESMLDRSLLYTGWTRSEKFLFLIGEREALERSVLSTAKKQRNTRLKMLIEATAIDMNFQVSTPSAAPSTSATSNRGSAGRHPSMGVPAFRPQAPRPMGFSRPPPPRTVGDAACGMSGHSSENEEAGILPRP